jgi:hypothetical protein
MMENFFVVVELPGGEENKLANGTGASENFRGRATDAIKRGEAKIVSRRNDTGVSEELRSHIEKVKRFKTYVLVNMRLDSQENEQAILKKAALRLLRKRRAMVVDAAHNFELVSVG